MHPDRLRIGAGPGALALTRYGHAERVLACLHGFPLAGFSWRHVAPVLARAGWMVLCPDLLGAGESDRPLDAPLAPHAQAGWVREVLAALGVTRAVVVGHDTGALVALHLAQQAPALVAGLVLVSPPDPEAMPGADVREMQRDTGRLALRLARAPVAAADLVVPLLAARARAPLTQAALAGATAPFVGRDGVQQLLALARALDPEGAPALDPAALPAPLALITGEGEPDGAGSALARLAGWWPQAPRHRVPGAARLAPEEAPAALAALLVTLLATHVTAAP